MLKKIILPLLLLLTLCPIILSADAQQTQTATPNLSLVIPYNHETNWGPVVVGDLSIIDSAVGGSTPAPWSLLTSTPFSITGAANSALLLKLDLSGNLTLAGGATFGGAVTLPGNPTSALQAATKQYVDQSVTAASAASAVTLAQITALGTLTNNTSGNAATASSVPYSGLTGPVPTWNQSTTGNAATASSVPYSGLTGPVPTWNQSTTGNAATATALAAAPAQCPALTPVRGISANGTPTCLAPMTLNGQALPQSLSGDSTISVIPDGSSHINLHVLGCVGASCANQSNANWTTTSPFTLGANLAAGDTSITATSTAGMPPVGCIAFNLPVEVDCYTSITGNVLNGRVPFYGTTAQAHSSGSAFVGIVSSVSASTSATPAVIVFNDGYVTYGSPQWNAPFQVQGTLLAEGTLSALGGLFSTQEAISQACAGILSPGVCATYYPEFLISSSTADTLVEGLAGGSGAQGPLTYKISAATGAGYFASLYSNNKPVCTFDGTTATNCPTTSGATTLAGDVTGTSGNNTVVAVHATTGSLDGVGIGQNSPSSGTFHQLQAISGSDSLNESHWTTTPTGTGIATGTPCWITHADSGLAGGAYATADCLLPTTGARTHYISAGNRPIGSEAWVLTQQDIGGNETFPGSVTALNFSIGSIASGAGVQVSETSGKAYIDSYGVNSSTPGAFAFRCISPGGSITTNCLQGDSSGDWTVPGTFTATGGFIGNASSASSVPYSGLTGPVPTWNQSTTGNAATATAFAAAPAACPTGSVVKGISANGTPVCVTLPSGSVSGISIASANGISGSSSGGSNPVLTLSLGAISPSSVTSSGNVVAGTEVATAQATSWAPNSITLQDIAGMGYLVSSGPDANTKGSFNFYCNTPGNSSGFACLQSDNAGNWTTRGTMSSSVFQAGGGYQGNGLVLNPANPPGLGVNNISYIDSIGNSSSNTGGFDFRCVAILGAVSYDCLQSDPVGNWTARGAMTSTQVNSTGGVTVSGTLSDNPNSLTLQEQGATAFIDSTGPNSSTTGSFDFRCVTAGPTYTITDCLRSDNAGNWTARGAMTSTEVYSTGGVAVSGGVADNPNSLTLQESGATAFIDSIGPNSSTPGAFDLRCVGPGAIITDCLKSDNAGNWTLPGRMQAGNVVAGTVVATVGATSWAPNSITLQDIAGNGYLVSTGPDANTEGYFTFYCDTPGNTSGYSCLQSDNQGNWTARDSLRANYLAATGTGAPNIPNALVFQDNGSIAYMDSLGANSTTYGSYNMRCTTSTGVSLNCWTSDGQGNWTARGSITAASVASSGTITQGGTSVCLQNGTNCPQASSAITSFQGRTTPAAVLTASDVDGVGNLTNSTSGSAGSLSGTLGQCSGSQVAAGIQNNGSANCVTIPSRAYTIHAVSRVFGGIYQNTTGVPIVVTGYGTIPSNEGLDMQIYVLIGPSSSSLTTLWGNTQTGTIHGEPVGFNFEVPAGWWYEIETSNGPNANTLVVGPWYENTY